MKTNLIESIYTHGIIRPGHVNEKYGDIYYQLQGTRLSGERYSYESVFSPLGIKLFSQNPDILTDPTHYSDRVAKRNIGNLFRPTYIADKKFSADLCKLYDQSGIDQFKALRTLIRYGIRCCEPLFARGDRIITVWRDGQHPDEVDPKFKEYLLEVKRAIFYNIQYDEEWNKKWIIETYCKNYIKDKYGFVLIDPISTFSYY